MTAPTAVTAKSVSGVKGGGTTLTPTAADATNGNSFYQDGHTTLRLVNTDTASHTVTFPYGKVVDGQTLGPVVITLAASEVRSLVVGVPDTGLYGPHDQVVFTANSALVKFELTTF